MDINGFLASIFMTRAAPRMMILREVKSIDQDKLNENMHMPIIKKSL